MPLPFRIEWLDRARADVRQIDRTTAMRIFESVLHHSRTGAGDYRVFFRLAQDIMYIKAVLHRSEAYR
jgi:mRNA-degrading endonuclease RelE of RelBE toxin-antitoxin system